MKYWLLPYNTNYVNVKIATRRSLLNALQAVCKVSAVSIIDVCILCREEPQGLTAPNNKYVKQWNKPTQIVPRTSLSHSNSRAVVQLPQTKSTKNRFFQ